MEGQGGKLNTSLPSLAVSLHTLHHFIPLVPALVIVIIFSSKIASRDGINEIIILEDLSYWITKC